MQDTVLAIVATIALAVMSEPASAVTCSNATIQGTLVAAVNRSLSGRAAASMDMESWDGAGHLQYLELDSYGTSSAGPYYGTGTYSIGKDCIATVYYDGGTAPWTFYVAPDGTGLSWINTQNVGIVSGGNYERISERLLVDPASATRGPCTAESLEGTLNYGFTYTFRGVPLSSAGRESYDGAGHLRYEEAYSDGYTSDVYSGAGTYTITDSCVASVYYDGSPTPMTFFVAPDGSAYWWVNLRNNGNVSAGKATRVSRGRVLK
jgi:hypothetical protein